MGYLFSVLGINNEIFQTIKKISKMKKFFAIAFIAVAFVACNNAGEKNQQDTQLKIQLLLLLQLTQLLLLLQLTQLLLLLQLILLLQKCK